MPNSMTFEQSATLLASAVKQATGQTVITNITTPEQLVSVAQTALKTGVDPILNAISQTWAETIFRIRDYKAPLSSLEWTLSKYGNAIRKLSPVAMEMVDNDAYKYPSAYDAIQSANPLGNGQSVDHYKIHKQEALQTNFYGESTYAQFFTIFREQFVNAMKDAGEFGRFNAMMMTERYNDRESYRESVARTLQANLIGGILSENNNDRVVHLLTEYNALTGLTLDAQSVYKPENFAPFMRWVYSRIKTLVRMMGERSQMFQTIISGKPILRFTRPEDMRIALFTPAMEQINAMVLSDTFHDDYLKGVTYEGVNFWQSIETPDSIAITPTYTNTNGVATKASGVVEQAGIFGLIHDREAIGYCPVSNDSFTTPLNIAGEYYNQKMATVYKTVSDNTEKAVVLLLD